MIDIMSIILGILAFFAFIVGFVILPYTICEWFIFRFIEGGYLKQLSLIIDGQIYASFWKLFKNTYASLKGKWGDKEIEVNLYRRFRMLRSPSPNIVIRLYHTFPLKISIWREISFPLVSAAPGFYNREEEISIGDLQFDQNYDIFSDSELNAKKFLTLKRKEIIQRLFTQRKIKYVDICSSYVELYFQFDDFSGFKKFENILSSTEFAEVLRDLKEFIE